MAVARRVPVLNLSGIASGRADGPPSSNGSGVRGAAVIMSPLVVQQLTTAIVKVVDEAERELSDVTEETVSDHIEGALRGFAGTLEAMAQQLPKTAEEYEAVADAIAAHSRYPAQGCPESVERSTLRSAQTALEDARLRLNPSESCTLASNTPAMSRAEALAGMRMVETVLSDVRTALNEVSREEIEEVAELGLAVARMAVTVAQTAARQLKRTADQNVRHEFERVRIEEVSDDSSTTATERGSSCSRTAHPRRYIWQALWPQVKSLPSTITRPWLAAQPPVALAFAVITSPVLFWIFVFLMPPLLFLDEVLQRLYTWKQEQVETLSDSTVQVSKLAYLTARLTVRQSWRVARSQLKRGMAGRTVGQVLKEWLSDPVGTLQTAGALGTRCAQAVAARMFSILGPLLRAGMAFVMGSKK